MVPTPSGGYADLTNPGIQGQGGSGFTSPAFTPREKVFDFHFIVQVPLLDGIPTLGNQYFDPSYGVNYASSIGFEAQAVAGYAYRFTLFDPPGVYRAFIPIPGSPNISFNPNYGRSM